MRVFLSEHLTCGAVPDAAADPLFPEGAAMLRALAADAVRVAGVEVVVLWAKGLPPLGVAGVEVVEATPPKRVQDLDRLAFDRLFWECDRTLHVCPESEWCGGWGNDRYTPGHLGEHGRILLGSTSSAVGECGDKCRLHQAVRAAGVRRPDVPPREKDYRAFPFVRKEDNGAGGKVWLYRNGGDIDRCPGLPREECDWRDMSFPPWTYEYFTEQYIPGRPCSAAVINDEPLPAGEQHIQIHGSPGRLSYHGGTVPAAEVDQAAVSRLVAQVYQAVPGLRGWWGIDFVIPDEPFEGSRDPVLIEVNPRLTTSYLGYRALTPDNLAERLLFPERAFSPLRWHAGAVTFSKDGRVDVTPG